MEISRGRRGGYPKKARRKGERDRNQSKRESNPKGINGSRVKGLALKGNRQTPSSHLYQNQNSLGGRSSKVRGNLPLKKG